MQAAYEPLVVTVRSTTDPPPTASDPCAQSIAQYSWNRAPLEDLKIVPLVQKFRPMPCDGVDDDDRGGLVAVAVAVWVTVCL